MSDINGFQNQYRFLSNFWFANVQLDGTWYSSTEHAYQAAKTLDKHERSIIKMAKNPAQAKALGKLVTKRTDWADVKEAVMRDLLLQKFSKSPLKDDLIATGNAYLEETNSWNDTYWGVCNGQGKNRLGYILMEVRQSISNGN